MGNDLRKIGLIGGGFQHAFSTTLYKHPSNFSWSKNEILNETFWIDDAIFEGIKSDCPNKYAWLVESRDIAPRSLQFVKDNADLVSRSFKYLFTHNKDIYDLAENFIFIPSHATWIETPQIYPKSKLVSIVSSNKNWTAGHRKRLEWVDRFREHADLFGMGFAPFDDKTKTLADYYFSICIENDAYRSYYSEKILDCFACGTIPVYYGAPDIGDHFDSDGIIVLDDDFDVSQLSIELYNSKIGAIKNNLSKVKEYYTTEDLIWKYLRL